MRILESGITMSSEYVEEHNNSFYITGTRISLDSVVHSFRRGSSPETIQGEFPLLKLSEIYGAIAFYLDHQATVDPYLERKQREFEASGIPLSQENPELWAKLEQARQLMSRQKE
jgi:hypothetical protein